MPKYTVTLYEDIMQRFTHAVTVDAADIDAAQVAAEELREGTKDEDWVAVEPLIDMGVDTVKNEETGEEVEIVYPDEDEDVSADAGATTAAPVSA